MQPLAASFLARPLPCTALLDIGREAWYLSDETRLPREGIMDLVAYWAAGFSFGRLGNAVSRTHNPDFARAMDRIIRLHEGRIEEP